MSLVPDYGGSSDSDSSDNSISDKEKSETEDIQKEQNIFSKLPPPDFQVKSIPDQNGLRTNSVFKNPFLEAENEKEAALQKHVKMVDLKNTSVINEKKICWNYRKGRCRFGHNCKFAHDSDVQKTPEQLQAEKIQVQTERVVVQKKQVLKHRKMMEENDDEDADSPYISKKRKRPGLSQGLIPGKKVMNNYMKNKN